MGQICKMTITATDTLEWIKITIALILGYIIIKALLFVDIGGEHIVKCAQCVCNGVIYLN